MALSIPDEASFSCVFASKSTPKEFGTTIAVTVRFGYILCTVFNKEAWLRTAFSLK